MQHLDLSPLPCTLPPENPRLPANAGHGFVDDAVVLALLTGTIGSRFHHSAETPALAADEMDYAVWPPSALPDALLFRRA